ncbi:MAG: two-component regulator propeller domain-containing protein [Bacteroidales bacterium]|nr:two-component regulator propeller domain-containing protein [Bacteroidales bacterium]
MIRSFIISLVFFVLCLWPKDGVMAANYDSDPHASRIPNLRFRSINTNDGLPSNGIYAIMQDRYGFVWIGTENGICRYDGNTFHKPQHGGDIMAEVLSMVYSDSAIWIGTNRGMFRYDPLTDTINPFEVKGKEGEIISSKVNCLSLDQDGRIWATTRGQGIFSFVPNGSSEIAAGASPIKNVMQHSFNGKTGYIERILVDSQNRVWAICFEEEWEEGLARLNKKTQQFETIQLRDKQTRRSIGSPKGMAIMEDQIGQMWVGTVDQGLLCFDRNTLLTTCVVPPHTTGMLKVRAMLEYEPGLIMVGGDEGLLAVDISSGECRTFAEDYNSPNSLSNKFVHSVAKDAEGGLWVGTFYGGVNYASPQAGHLVSEPGHTISHICEDASGRIWMASDDAGLLSLSDGFKITRTPLKQKSLQTDNSSSINGRALCVRGDELWFGTSASGIIVVDLKTQKTRHYSTLTDADGHLISSHVSSFKIDREGKLWVGTFSGVSQYDATTDSFKPVKLFGDAVIDIDQDTDGNLWFCTMGNGVWQYHEATNEWKNYINRQYEAPRANVSNCIYIGEDRQIWLATNDGLCLYDATTDEFKLELPGRVASIVPDRHRLWLACNNGIVCYDTQSHSVSFQTRDDAGLGLSNYLANSATMTSDGRVLVGSSRGLVSFIPDLMTSNKQPQRVALTQLKVFDSVVEAGSELLPCQLALMPQLDLNYKQNFFEIQFALLSYSSPMFKRYSYKLEGFDKDWVYTNTPEAPYTNVPPGNYTLLVRGTTGDQPWDEQMTALPIVIHPPFYWNTTAQIVYLLLILMTIAMIVWWSMHQVKRRYAEKLKLQADKAEKQIQESRMNFFTTIAHEIRTPVSLIIGPIEQILHHSEHLPSTIRTHLGVVERNSQRLLDLVNQLLDYRKVEMGTTGYHFKCQPVTPIMRSAVEQFELFVNQQGATIETHFPNEEIMAIVDQEAMNKLVSNMLMNATKYTRTHIWVGLQVESDETFTISVRDDGPGMTDEVRQRVFEPFYQADNNKPGTGIGLSIVKGIVEAHFGTVDVRSQPGLGTCFSVNLPLHRAGVDDFEQVKELVSSNTKTNSHDKTPETIVPHSAISTNISGMDDQATVLIVDDNEELLNFLSNCMSEHYRILTASSGAEALSVLHKEHVTLVISDWMMPNMNGGELCRRIRQNTIFSHIPIILLTAKADDASKIEGMDCGADTYIEKPFSVDYVLACTRNLLDLRRMLHETFATHPLAPVSTLANNPTDADFLQHLTALIEQNFERKELTVDFLADKMCMSRSGFFAKVKALSDVSAGEMIQLIRLKKATQLLLEGNHRIAEIGYMVGFSSPSYFTRCFTSQFGVKPSEFIAQKKGKIGTKQ